MVGVGGVGIVYGLKGVLVGDGSCYDASFLLCVAAATETHAHGG